MAGLQQRKAPSAGRVAHRGLPAAHGGLALGGGRIDVSLRRAAGDSVAMSVAGRSSGDIGAVLVA